MFQKERLDYGCQIMKEYMERHEACVRLLMAVSGGEMTTEDAEKELRDIERKRQVTKKKAIHSACAALRYVNRPLCRRDMEVSIEFALYEAAKKYEKEKNRDNAVYLLALAACRKLVYGEPLYGEDDTDGD